MAANSTQEYLLRSNLQSVDIVPLEGYNVRYARSGYGFMLSMVKQLPRLVKTVRKEHKWLKDYAAQTKVDGIISDNRYGIFHENIPSVILTHQLSVKSGLGNHADHLLRKVHYKYLEKFPQCWVPDVDAVENLAGNLSRPEQLPAGHKYIGLLSQMEINTMKNGAEHLLILLSGPEPQRSILSDLLWKQVGSLKGKVVFVEGSNSAAARKDVPRHVNYHTILSAKDLQPVMEAASLVICRSGYSSIMDLVKLDKKAVLIPTPGQTEQEYLARHLQKQGLFPFMRQDNFNLPQALSLGGQFAYNILNGSTVHQQFIPVLNEWVASLP